MSEEKLRRPRWLLAALVGGVFAVALWADRVGQSVRPPSKVPSIDNPGPQGLEAAFRYLDASHRAGVLHGSLEHLPPDARVVVTALPYEEGFSPEEKAALKRWVEEGGTLVVLGEHDWDLGGAAGDFRPPAQALDISDRQVGVTELGEDVKAVVDSATRPTPRDIIPALPAVPDPITAGIERLSVSSDRGFAAVPGAALPLLVVGDTPVALALRRGSGRVIAFAGPDAFTNQRLDQLDNPQLLANLAGLAQAEGAAGGRIYFDEYHHTPSSSAMRASLGFAGAALAQFALVAVLVVLSSARRLAKVREAPAAPTRSVADYAQHLGRLYLRSGLGGAICSDALRELRSTMSARVGIPTGEPHEKAARMLAHRRRIPELEYLSLVAALSAPSATAAQATQRVAQMVELKNRL